MGFINYSTNIVREILPGDDSKTGVNRLINDIRDFLVSTGHFSVVAEALQNNDPNKYAKYVLLQFRQTDVHIIIRDTSIRVGYGEYNISSTGILFTYDIVYYNISGLPTTGLYNINIIIGTHFFESRKLGLKGISTTKGWLMNYATLFPSTAEKPYYFVSVKNGSEREVYDLTRYDVFSKPTVSNQHVLIEPSILRGVPRLTTDGNKFFLDEEVLYLGEFYGKQSSLGIVNVGAIYKDSTGKEYYISEMYNGALMFCD